MSQSHEINFVPEPAAMGQPSSVQGLQDGTTANRALAVTVALSFLLLLAAALLVFQISREAAGAEAAVVRTLGVKQASSELLNMLSTAESGQRGYLLTRDERLLEPLHAVRRDLDGKLRELQSLVADNPPQSARLEALTPRIIERLGAIQQTLSFAAAGRQAEASRVVVERGAPLMDEVRRRFAEFEAAEDQLLLARQQHAAAISQSKRVSR
jgi:hypothetical protein